MIAELILMMAGHPSSLFLPSGRLNPVFSDLLHPGEQSALEYLSQIALKYRSLRGLVDEVGGNCVSSSRGPTRDQRVSEYQAALCSALRVVLRDYEAVIVQTEAKILQNDDEFVSSSSFVPLGILRAVFSEWDAPMTALHNLMNHIQSFRAKDDTTTAGGQERPISPGELIDLLLERSSSGVARVASIMNVLALAVQRVWRKHLTAYLVHGVLSPRDPFAFTDPIHRLNPGLIPRCISLESRDTIVYIGRALMTVRSAAHRAQSKRSSSSTSSNQHQLPRALAVEHSKLLARVLPQDSREFDAVMSRIRGNISEWLWTTVLTRKDVDEAIDSLANFFLMRNGEFSVALIREIERLKRSRLTPKASSNPGLSIIREQDLSLVLLRASLGTQAEHDPSLTKLKFKLPTGPLRPFLPSVEVHPDMSVASIRAAAEADTNFSSTLLGTRLELTYDLTWPLDLLLTPNDLRTYTNLFSYFSAIRYVHQRVMGCWSSLSRAQRARRGSMFVNEVRISRDVLRLGWGVVREMMWFFDNLWNYICFDVVEAQYEALRESTFKIRKEGSRRRSGRRDGSTSGVSDRATNTEDEDDVATERPPTRSDTRKSRIGPRSSFGAASGAGKPAWSAMSSHAERGQSGHISTANLDFATLRVLHSAYLYALHTGSLLGNAACAHTIKSIMELCDVFAATLERWGGDVVPDMLSQGSLGDGDGTTMLEERRKTLRDTTETLNTLLETFYDQLVQSLSSQTFGTGVDATVSGMGSGLFGAHVPPSAMNGPRAGQTRGPSVNRTTDSEVRRTVERLLLRLDFNNGFTAGLGRQKLGSSNILREGGLA